MHGACTSLYELKQQPRDTIHPRLTQKARPAEAADTCAKCVGPVVNAGYSWSAVGSMLTEEIQAALPDTRHARQQNQGRRPEARQHTAKML